MSNLPFSERTAKYHPLLRKQLDRARKHRQDNLLEYLFSLINQVYEDGDKERRMIEHTMSVMTAELNEAYDNLMAQKLNLEKSQERYLLVAEAAQDGLWDWDLIDNTFYFSPRFREILEIPTNHEFNCLDHWFALIPEDDRDRIKRQIDLHLEGATPRIECEFPIKTFLGRQRFMQVRALAARTQGKATRLSGSQTDITERKRQEKALFSAAFHDELTGLANRVLFFERLNQCLAREMRLGAKRSALLFIDLDRFKYINDSLGHEFGDEVLKLVAEVLKTHTRPDDTVARLGGDEFTVLLDSIDNIDIAIATAERILGQLNRPYEIQGREVYIASSIGLSMIDNPRMDPESILRNADLAMYEAKSAGKARLEIFDKKQHDRILWRMQSESDLRKVVARSELEVFYQPIVNLQNGQVKSFEALVRWFHPKKGYISPAVFIPIAEEVGLIGKIGQMVLEKVCKQITTWQTDLPIEFCPNVAVNLSVRQLMDNANYQNVLNILKNFKDITPYLKLEVTESVIMSDPDLIIKRLQEIHELGVKLSIDDFGTGYSSLSYLHNYPFQTLKIDRTFISTMMVDQKSERLVASIIGLAKDLSLEIIAEGVETEEQMNRLIDMQCDFAQGYYFSHPMNASDATTIVHSQQTFPIKDMSERERA